MRQLSVLFDVVAIYLGFFARYNAFDQVWVVKDDRTMLYEQYKILIPLAIFLMMIIFLLRAIFSTAFKFSSVMGA